MDFTKGQIRMMNNMVNCELENSKTVYDRIELKNLKQVLNLACVVGRSEQLFCNCGFNSSTFQLETGEICCCNCEKEIAK